MKTTAALLALLALALCFVPPVLAAPVTFDWATVGDPGNAGELSGSGSGGWGPDAIVGGVDHTYRISKHEVTAGQYTEFLNAVAASDPYGLYNTSMWSSDYGCKIERTGSDGSYNYQVAADRANRPVNYVSFLDAMRFVNWLENGQGSGDTETGVYTISTGVDEGRSPDATYFIPSEDEWYKAAYYDPSADVYYDYPIGTDSVPSNDLIDPDPGNNANFYQGGYTIGRPYYTTEVGEFENSESPYGTFDQGGNVWEWNDAVLSGSFRGLRGGSFNYYGDYDYLQAAGRNDGSPMDEYTDVGFRVASIPEPACVTLMLVSGVAVGMLRRRRAYYTLPFFPFTLCAAAIGARFFSDFEPCANTARRRLMRRSCW